MGDQKFKKGDLVKWESQAASHWTVKKGRIYQVIPKGKLPLHESFSKYPFCAYALSYPDHKIMFDSWMPRTQESYLVEVLSGKTAKAKPKLYWPHASKLIGIREELKGD